MKCLFFAFLFSSSLCGVLFVFPEGANMNDDIYLYAVRYGHSRYLTKYIFFNDKENLRVEFDWLFYLLKYGKNIMLIDTGFSDPVLQKQFGVAWQDPVLILQNKFNIKPEDVTDVIITHNHFDHIGCVDKYVNARIYINKTDLTEFLNRNADTHIRKFLAMNDNLVIFDDEKKIDGMITIKHIGGHTAGSCAVYLDLPPIKNFITGDIGSAILITFLPGKKIVITGDECYLNDNFLKQIPVGTYHDVEKNLEFIRSLQNTDMTILTFHEPSIVGKNDTFANIDPRKPK